METGFTIDDVRGTLTQDVTRLLGRIERAARDILDDRTPALDGKPVSLAGFLAISDHSHAIHGTSSLVSAQSLADSSARMEALAHHGRDQLARALRHLASARDIAVAIAGGSTDMLAMLSHELDGRPTEARAIAESWRLRVDDVLRGSSAASGGPESVADPTIVAGEIAAPSAPPPITAAPHGPGSVDDGWGGFDDASAAPAAAALRVPVGTPPVAEYSFASIAELPRDDDAVVDPDLAEVFALEASNTLAMLDDALAALAVRLDDRALIKSIERGLHTLKGAAATVGLAAVSARAAELQDRAELLVEAGRPVTASEAAALVRDTAALRQLAGIPAPAAGPPTAPALAVFDEMAAELEREARTVLDKVEHLLADLRDAAPPAASPIARELGLAMHRLYSSALIANLPELAEAAATAQLLAEATPVDTSRLAAELARCRTLVVRRPPPGRTRGTGPTAEAHRPASDDIAALAPPGGLPPPGATHRVPVPVPDAEVDASFQQECADLLELVDRSALALERSDRPRDPIGDLLRGYHTLKGVVNALGLQPIGAQLHRVEDLLERLSGSAILPPLRAITGVLLWFHGELRRQLATVRLGYVELEPGRLDARLTRLLHRASSSTSTSARSSHVSGESRLGEGSEASAPLDSPVPDRRNLRVSIDRLDALMNLTGELVISRSRLLGRLDWLRGLQVDLGRSSRRVIDVVEKFRDDHEFSRFARGGRDRPVRWSGFSELELDRYEDVNILARSLNEGSNDLQDLFGQLAGGLGALADDSDALGMIIAGIQGEVTRTRMVPLDTLFSRLELPVRDAAQRADREVQVETVGADVHLDKTIADALFQPMLHLVRNAVSHGIEAPHVRIAAGKPAHGTITLRARQELGQIVVEIADDGAGLDLERLRERGAALGLVAHDTPLDDPRIRDLIFVHGLSTHVGADAVAGRGIGCDVVRRAVDRLNGSLRVETVRHERTVFSITLPVTLAITRALLVRNAGETFAVPLYFTERIIDAHEVEVIESAHQRRIELDGAFVPIRPLGEFVSGATSPAGPILLLAVGAQQLVVQVDEVITQEEIVVKSLGALLRGHPMFAGVTIRGTGQTVLILDVPSMTDSALGRRPAAQPVYPASLAAPPAVAAAPAPVTVPIAPADRDRPLHVLFVDDSVSVRKVAERTLRQLGVEVTLATDGADALDKLRNGQFDMVFTDLEMPRMHGYELIRELRFLPAFRTLPVVVVTSRSGKKHRDEAQTLGASEYLTKPFTSHSLAAALVKFGGTRAAGRVAAAVSSGEVSS